MRLAIVVSVALLAGCATKEQVWDKPGATEDGFYRDRAACQNQVFTQTANAFQGQVVFITCMQSRGWYSVDKR